MSPTPNAHPLVPLSAVSIHDYEALMAPRGAFVDFLLRPPVVMKRQEYTGSPSLAV